MSPRKNARRVRARLAVLGAASVAISVVMMNPAAAEPNGGPSGSPAPSDSRASEEKSMAREHGISRAEAAKRMNHQAKATSTARAAVKDLGRARTGGAYIDAKTGSVVVTVTDRDDAAKVERSGGHAKVVAHSVKQLSGTRASLDDLARSRGAGHVQSWYVDVPSNRVVVTTQEGADGAATKSFLKRARDLGQEVTVKTTTAKTVPVADLQGGQQVEMDNGYICSNGFNATSESGETLMITAGHCAEGDPGFSRDGVVIGPTKDSSFPTNDYAAVTVDTEAWTAKGTVDTYDGSSRAITGAEPAIVGASVCKSGRTSKWTCGTIEATDQSVNYGNGDIVDGLVRHSACVEQGDSGGSNVAGTEAQGVSSGAQLFDQGGELVCGERVGQANVSFYQPVAEALEAYGATLITE